MINQVATTPCTDPIHNVFDFPVSSFKIGKHNDDQQCAYDQS